MSRPSPRELFALYHLGLDREGRYRFRNLHDCARAHGVDAATFEGWLRRHRLDAASVKRVDFNLAVAHAEAQFVAADRVAGFVAETWAAFEAARAGRPLTHDRLDVDYEDVWGDGRSADDDAEGEGRA
jgi:hypothetical protein